MKDPMNSISAEVIADSISPKGHRITTFRLIYPRFVHSEFMTHRLFSRNSSSSRAIPVQVMLDQIRSTPAYPVHWGRNQSGMQAKEELDSANIAHCKALWRNASHIAADYAQAMADLGLHKQVSNRLVEPFQMMNVILTATEYHNFFHLRNHSDADPNIQALSLAMYDSLSKSRPNILIEGEWHTPFVPYIDKQYWVEDTPVPLEVARNISASVCAQVSFRKEDLSLEKAERIIDRLINSDPCHASPVEHQATPISANHSNWRGTPGITHTTKNGDLWSGNFNGWIQYRKLLPNEAVW